MKRILLLSVLVLFTVLAYTQNVKYVEEPAIKKLVSEYIKNNEQKPEFKGFRIQLFSSSDYENAKKVRFDFRQAFPGVSAYLKYQQPNYKIRVGNYRTRLEAEKFKADIIKHGQFKSCFIVPDKINFPKL